MIEIKDEYIRDYRVSNDSPFEGLLIYCNWENKDELRKQILKDNIKANDWDEMNKEALKFRKLWEKKLQEIKQLKAKLMDMKNLKEKWKHE